MKNGKDKNTISRNQSQNLSEICSVFKDDKDNMEEEAPMW